MKKSATKTVLLVMIAIVSVLMVAQIAKAASDIATTKHNLSTFKASGISGHDLEICIYCHTPHAAVGTAVPLWNRSTATQTYTLYSSPMSTLNATMAQPAGVSLACLSCHDGVFGVDAYGANAGTDARKITAGATLLSTNLSNDHPISFTYNAALATADGGLKTPESAALVSAGIPLFSSKMECASCHSVHDNTNAPFLRISNAGSALCLKCHNK